MEKNFQQLRKVKQLPKLTIEELIASKNVIILSPFNKTQTTESKDGKGPETFTLKMEDAQKKEKKIFLT